jgi:ribosomal protein L14
MIYPGTIMNCNDNSGALTVKCISIKNSPFKKGATAGSLVVVTVKTCLKSTSKVQRGSIQHGVVTRTNQILTRVSKSGDTLRFSHNSIVLLSKKNNYLPIGTRVLGPIAKEV